MVIWTPSTCAELKAIHDYIAMDAPINAKSVARDFVRKADTLAGLPYLGKAIPEVNEDSLREISPHSWRILYHLRQDNVLMLAVVHKRRQLSADDVNQRLSGE